MVNILRVRTVFNYGGGSPGLMTNYFDVPSHVYDAASAQLAVDRVRDAMLTQPNLFPTQFSWTVTGDVQQINDTNGQVNDAFGVISRTGAGTANSGLGPLPVGLLLKHKTSVFVDGRRLVGRTFFVPVAKGAIEGPSVSPAMQALVVSIGTALSNAGTTAVNPVIWSRPRPATPVDAKHPAGPARAERLGSSSRVTGYESSANYVVMTSRRD